MICQKINISDIEYDTCSGRQVSSISVQEWSDYNIKQFIKHQELLSTKEKETLASFLKICLNVL